MQKYNKESPVEQVLCLNHGLHLSVIKFFYKKEVDASESDDESSDNEEDIDTEEEDNNEAAHYGLNGDDLSIFKDMKTIETDGYKNSNFCKQLQALRITIKYFRSSPLRNDFLQEKIKKRLGKELELKLDIKTRWNSIDPMIKRYFEVKDEVKEALIYFNCLHLLTPIDEEYLRIILKVLEPVRIAAEALGRNDATIFSAENIMELLCTTRK